MSRRLKCSHWECILKQESMLNCLRHWGIIAVMRFIGPGRDQEEVAKVALAEIHEVGHQIPASVYRQQQQLQHPDHHADAVQPQNAPRLILLPRWSVQHMTGPNCDADIHAVQNTLMPTIGLNKENVSLRQIRTPLICIFTAGRRAA